MARMGVPDRTGPKDTGQKKKQESAHNGKKFGTLLMERKKLEQRDTDPQRGEDRNREINAG